MKRIGVRTGFTLVEMLVVIAILALVTALMIPQIRSVTKDRGIREASRIAGSVFADASTRARIDGFAGVAITRNTNFYRMASSGGNQLFYAGYSLYQMRMPAPYTGNNYDDVASSNGASGPFNVDIPTPLDPAMKIESGCYVQLGDSAVKYRILGVTPQYPYGAVTTITLSVELPAYLPRTPVNNKLTFKIFRRPEIVSQSRVDMPRGYFINLNYSGIPAPASPTGQGSRDSNAYTWTAFSDDWDPTQTTLLNENLEPIFIFFGANGGIDEIWTNGMISTIPAYDRIIPSSSVYLCVAPDEVGNTYDLTGTQLMPKSYYEYGTDVLNDPSMMWVSINHQSGATSIGENATVLTPLAEATVGTDQPARMLECLKIAGKRKQATQ